MAVIFALHSFFGFVPIKLPAQALRHKINFKKKLYIYIYIYFFFFKIHYWLDPVTFHVLEKQRCTLYIMQLLTAVINHMRPSVEKRLGKT